MRRPRGMQEPAAKPKSPTISRGREGATERPLARRRRSLLGASRSVAAADVLGMPAPAPALGQTSWLGTWSPVDALSPYERSSLLVGSDFSLSRYFAQLRQTHGFGGGLPVLRPPSWLASRPLRLLFVGDSIAHEMAAACQLLSERWACNYSSPAMPFLCGASFAQPDCSELRRLLPPLVEAHDLVVLAHGTWLSIPAHITDPSSRA